MFPPRLFRIPTFRAAIATGFLMMAAQMSAAFMIVQYLQVALGYRPLAAGLRFLPMTATPLVVAPLAGLFSDRVGARLLMATGLLLQASGLAWFALEMTAGVGYSRLILPLLVAGIGVSMPFATVGATIVGAVAPRDMGRASGANSTILTFGGAFGLAVVTAMYAAYSQHGSAAGFVAGVRPALLVTAFLAALGGITALGVGGHRQPAPASREVNRQLAPDPAA